jgi:tRNA 2-selenouridine synthase
MRTDTDDYRQIFLQGLPLMDTRAPIEFCKGAFPNATNLPLLTDSEREQVGICYKKHGQPAAIELGQQLVAGVVKQQRLLGWEEFSAEHPEGYLYCFRGGLRSRTTQQWMREQGVEYPLVQGGYKAMRRFLIDEMERSIARAQLVLVAGKTGTGKTRVIEVVPRAIDLEGLAVHRGSSFGRLPSPQPTQIDFENSLSIALLRMLDGDDCTVVLEDEGKLIGRTALPEQLRDKMQLAPLLLVEEPVAERVQVILEDYVQDLGRRYQQISAEEGASLHRQHLLDGLERISKRLGGVLFGRLATQMDAAFERQHELGDDSLHRLWIEGLLVEYYDPMYEYQMSRREGKILGRGCRQQVTLLARDYNGSPE